MNTTLIIIGILVIAFIALVFAAKAKLKKIPLVEDHKKIVTLTSGNFQHQIKNKIMLVDFWASWCAPCRMLAPALNELAAEVNGNKCVGKVNIEQQQSLAQQFGVRSIPTLIILKNGKEVKRMTGVKSKDFLLKELNNVK